MNSRKSTFHAFSREHIFIYLGDEFTRYLLSPYKWAAFSHIYAYIACFIISWCLCISFSIQKFIQRCFCQVFFFNPRIVFLSESLPPHFIESQQHLSKLKELSRCVSLLLFSFSIVFLRNNMFNLVKCVFLPPPTLLQLINFDIYHFPIIKKQPQGRSHTFTVFVYFSSPPRTCSNKSISSRHPAKFRLSKYGKGN